MMEWLAAQDIEKIGNTLIFVLTGLAVLFGLKRPAAQDPAIKTEKPALEVATDFFDAEAVGNLTREVTGHAIALTAATLAMNRHSDAIGASTFVLAELRDLTKKYMADKEEENERRLERRAEQAELENQRLRIRVEDLARRMKLDPMERD